MKKINKKGIIFTILALLISSIVITLFFSFKEVPLDNSSQNIKIRIQQVNMYITQVEMYIKDVTKISTLSALDFAINQMIDQNAYYSDFDSALQRCMISGVLPTPGNEGAVIACPDSAKLQANINEIGAFAAENLTIQSVVRVNNIKLTQTTPWQIIVTVNYSIKVEDSYATWDAVKTLNQTVNIVGLNDPTYWIVQPSLSSYKYLNAFKQVENQGLWLETPSTANYVTVNKIYFKYENAPSFLNRVRGNMSNSTCCGIASIVPPLDSISNPDLSNLDYIFWKNNICSGIEENQYYRFNFWKSGMTEIDRLSRVIPESGYGLNGSIVPPSFATFVNMTNTSYIDVLTPTCTPII
ncbi:hypothetical protein COV13_01130 [Candidatus Woesearchaeota archaeon CG10_big_fil_rev_8_21_14_0_10_32_9]|nr:MAG: hypothetical protein COV13_01130 [Candidatus Woesearchaeota archaeon CG10_big_fil_rev_8_21_14_0_10_32_9]